MAPGIVLFGASGHTGALAAERLVALGTRPLLAGRDGARVAALAASLGGLEHAQADARDPEALSRLLGPSTVLVNTVGPFSHWGDGVLAAAIARGATYMDCTGEPGFIRAAFERHGAQAQRAGVCVLPALGYDYVPGALAGGLVLAQAGQAATRVEIGYFVEGPRTATSAGTRKSAARALMEDSFAFRDGAIRTVRLADRGRRMLAGGSQRPVVSVGGAEAFGLPAFHAGLRDVEVFAGFFGRATPLVRLASGALAGLRHVPRAHAPLGAALEAYAGRGGSPPQAAGGRTRVIARAYDATGRRRAQVELAGPDPYAFTAAFLAWAAARCAAAPSLPRGTHGPLTAFGLEALAAGCAHAGLERSA